MKKIIIKKHRIDNYQRGYIAAQRDIQRNDEESGSGCLCFFLGFALGPIGVIVAAIIGKAGGVKSALFGCLLDILLFFLIYGAIVFIH